jgi:hypothetical protein
VIAASVLHAEGRGFDPHTGYQVIVCQRSGSAFRWLREDYYGLKEKCRAIIRSAFVLIFLLKDYSLVQVLVAPLKAQVSLLG